MRRFVVLVSLALVACSPASSEVRPAAPRANAAGRAEAPGALDVAALLASRGVRPDRLCLVHAAGAAPALAAPLAAAVRPAPALPPDLSARLDSEPRGFSLFTLYGRFGEGALPLAAMTRHAPPRGPVWALGVGRGGFYLWGPRERPAGPYSAAESRRALAERGVDEAALVAVVPEARAPAAALVEALALVDETGAEPTLAFPLPEHTAARQDRAPAPSRAGTCDALPARDGPRGALPEGSIGGAMRALAAGARSCRAASRSYEAARGGVLGLLLRVGRGGEVTEACFDEDTVGDPSLRACVLSKANALRFDAPPPAGAVDLRVPLRFPRDESDRARGICEGERPAPRM